ncbi:hypothetical protein PRUB_a2283 [Pseudoalteromonas rubra]|uniref:Uncharacterized protein n=1 Tax=Pseudoalteromonas rubra TaxID=43658 RepID=A0A8T0CCP0_9GAMM|nr:hypothetical protein PRUB_a2283 [Pseudoalteromonas rubra]
MKAVIARAFLTFEDVFADDGALATEKELRNGIATNPGGG